LMRLIDAAVLAVGPQDIDELVAGAEAVGRGQGAVPLDLRDRRDRDRDDRDGANEVAVGGAVEADFKPLDETGIVAAHEELHRLDDPGAVVRNNRGRRDGEFRLSERRILSRPYDAAVRQGD